jgi:hypothetical protein
MPAQPEANDGTPGTVTAGLRLVALGLQVNGDDLQEALATARLA